jgi:hypothetical protein
VTDAAYAYRRGVYVLYSTKEAPNFGEFFFYDVG